MSGFNFAEADKDLSDMYRFSVGDGVAESMAAKINLLVLKARQAGADEARASMRCDTCVDYWESSHGSKHCLRYARTMPENFGCINHALKGTP
jgi:hypothetical protein